MVVVCGCVDGDGNPAADANGDAGGGDVDAAADNYDDDDSNGGAYVHDDERNDEDAPADGSDADGDTHDDG
eukprot:14946354-Alexandrium_andersonii.AAC.1